MKKIYSWVPLIFTFLLCYSVSTTCASTRTWIGAGAAGGNGGLDLTNASNWNGGTALLTTDDYVMTLTPGTSDGIYVITQGTGIAAFNSLNITFAATGTTQRTIDITLTSSFTITTALTITNSTSNGNANHAISFNINSGTLTCGSVTTNGNGIAPGLSSLNINVQAGAALLCNGKWKSSTLNLATVYTYIKNSGTVTITDSTILNNSGNAPLRVLVDNSPAKFSFNGNVKLGTTAKSEYSTNAPNTVLLGGIASTSSGSFVFNANNDTTILGYNMGTENFHNGTFLFTGTGEVIFTYSKTGAVPDRSPGTFQIGTAIPANVSYLLSTGENDALTVYNSLIVNTNSIFSVKAAVIPSDVGNKATIEVRAGATLNLGVKGGKSSTLPNNYLQYVFDSTSTLNYNGDTQVVYAGAKYGNLTLSGTGPKTANASLYIAGNFLISGSATFDINDSTKSFADTVSGSWTDSSTDPSGGFISSGTGNVTVVFNGNSNTTIGGSAPSNFYNIAINKNSLANTIDVKGNITITASTATTSMSTGIVNVNSGGSLSKTGSGGVLISDISNGTASLYNSGGSISINGPVRSNGTFKQTAGTTVIGNSSGNSLTTRTGGAIDIEGGNISIAGRLVNSAGSAKITGGNIVLSTIGNSLSDTGSFHMSLSTMLSITGGTITFQNPSTASGTKQDLNILNNAVNKSVTGGTFIFGNSSTPSGSIFQCYSANSVPLYNFTLDQNTPTVILTNNLTINGTTALNSGILNINGNSLTLNGAQTSTTGTLSGSLTSGLIIGNSTNSLKFTSGGFNNYLKTLTVNASKTAAILNALNIAASNGITSGTFGTVTINSGGTLNTNGFLSLKSDQFGDAIVGNSGGSINGDVTVERYINKRRAWRLLTVPFLSSSQSINAAWQEGITNNVQPTVCPTADAAPNGYGMYITYYNANGYDWNTTTSPSLKFWNGVQWLPPASTTSGKITDYPGYYVFVRGDRHVCIQYGQYATANPTVLRAKGLLKETGTSATQSFSAVKDSFVVVGNPYASPIDFTKGTYPNLNAQTFYVLDPQVGGTYGVGKFIMYNTQVPIGWNITTGSYKSTTGPIVQSGQAFLLKAASTATGDVTFPQSVKSITEFNTSGFQANPNNPRSLVYTELLLPNDSLKTEDNAIVIYGDKYRLNDSIYSATKFWSSADNLSIWNNGFYAISCRPLIKISDTIFYKAYLAANVNYAIKFYLQNIDTQFPVRAWLIDNYLNSKTEINLGDTSLFNFTTNVDTNSYRNRFMLVLNKQLLTIPVPVTKVANQKDPNVTGIATTTSNRESGINIYPNPVINNKATLNFINMNKGSYEVTVYNITGTKLLLKEIFSKGGKAVYELPVNASWAAGAYIVCVTNKDLACTKKLKLIISK